MDNKDSVRFVTVPASIVNKHRAETQRQKLASARFRYTHDGYHTRENFPNRGKSKYQRTNDALLNKDFIMWDGEGPRDAGYALFGNSEGYEICHPFLSTLECFDLMFSTEMDFPDAIHVGFGFNYDVSNIIKDIPRRYQSVLHTNTRCIWEDWEISHVPHKWFSVKRGKVDCTIYDIHSFFAGSYVNALLQFGIGTGDQINRLVVEKLRRSEFLWDEIDDIRQYWQLELKLGPELCEALRESLNAGARYVPRSWHGPGAVARMALKRHDVYAAMADCPYDVNLAARYAFAGGRFEGFLAGHYTGPIYEADINSAYPYYATMLPNLAKGKWRKGCRYEPGKFAVYHIRYESKPDSERCYPLFKRQDNNQVCWPYRVEGWYWAPEAELVAGDNDAKFIESWVFDEYDPSDRPFAWLTQYYHNRKAADRAGSIAGFAFKIIINAVYGQLAQRAGWDKKRGTPPRSHQLEWAGYITSGCRASVYKAAIAAGDKLISINTDSIQTLAPIDYLPSGSQLGEWKIKEYCEGIFWQSGIYYLRENLGYPEALGYGWDKGKTRGIPKGSYTPQQLLECLAKNEPLRLNKKVFITYGLADMGQWDKRNQWLTEPHEFEFGGSGKRSHNIGPNGSYCDNHCMGDLHRLTAVQIPHMFGDGWSKLHYLPWLDRRDDTKETMDAMYLFDADHLEFDDEWVRDEQWT